MPALICPICNVATAFTPDFFQASVSLSTTLGTQLREGVATAITPLEPGKATYAIIICQSCNKRFVATKKADEWQSVFPILTRLPDDLIPEPIRGQFGEANLCFAVGAYRAAVTMCQTALEAMWREKQSSGLDDLKDKGIISEKLRSQAEEIRLWANIIKHDKFPDPINREDAEQLLAYLEVMLHEVYVAPARLAALSQKRKELPKGTKPEQKLPRPLI